MRTSNEKLIRRKTGRTTETWTLSFTMQVIEGGKLRSKEFRESTGVQVDTTNERTIKESRKLAWGVGQEKLKEINGDNYLGHEAKKRTIYELLETYVAFKTRKNPHGLTYACKFLNAEFGAMRANDFDYRDFLRWREKMEAAGYGHGTIDKITRLFRAAFHLGQQLHLVTNCPMLPCYNEDDARQGFLEYPEYMALHNALERLEPALADLWAFGYYSGCRPSEAEGLCWEHVSAETKSVTFIDTKTGDSRTISLPQMWEIVEKRIRQRTTPIAPWVFNVAGEPIDSNLRNRVFRRACKSAGYTGRIWYDLRRTFYRNMINCGVPEVTVMSITGHKTRAMAKRYAIRSVSDMWQAGKMLESALVRQVPDSIVTVAATKSMKSLTGGIVSRRPNGAMRGRTRR